MLAIYCNLASCICTLLSTFCLFSQIWVPSFYEIHPGPWTNCNQILSCPNPIGLRGLIQLNSSSKWDLDTGLACYLSDPFWFGTGHLASRTFENQSHSIGPVWYSNGPTSLDRQTFLSYTVMSEHRSSPIDTGSPLIRCNFTTLDFLVLSSRKKCFENKKLVFHSN
jgi:hypothetical protein